jgi:hypothetical protein
MVSIADRDLTRFVIPDGESSKTAEVVLVPGIRLGARWARGVQRFARTG